MEKEMKISSPLHICKVQQPDATVYKVHNLFHALALLALLYYRASSFHVLPTLPWALITASELLLCFLWLLRQPFRWHPVYRTVFSERLPGDDELPAVDVFICTVDPNKEPTLEVMYTVVSAMSLDYPPEKLSVYLSDDAGSSLTLYAIHEAASFASFWVPFCRIYRIGTICPDAFLSGSASVHGDDDTSLRSMDFISELEKMKSKYEVFKERVGRAKEKLETWLQDRPRLIQDKESIFTLQVLTRRRSALSLARMNDDLLQLRSCYGNSNKFIASLHHCNPISGGISSDELLQEAQILTSCSYEKDTQWEGISLPPMVEDYFSGFIMHCRGWKSVYYEPSKPAFLGSSTISFNESMIQNLRWNSGLFEVCLSSFCPIIYGVSRMSIPQAMAYGYYAFQPLYSFPLLCYATTPQLCLLNGVSLYPKVSNPWFIIFAISCISSLSQHLSEVLLCGDSLRTWWNEQRTWMIKSVVSYTLSCVDVIMKRIGIREANFMLTSKVINEEQVEKYKKGIFDFRGSKLFQVILATLVTINMVSLVGGLARVVFEASYDDMFVQISPLLAGDREKEMKNTSPLHVCKVQQPDAIIYKVHNLFHAIALLALLYYRVSSFDVLPTLPWALVTASELLLCFL
ncbi:hypothetical protein NE237_015768 [Protea cynaroides]|uniref:Cellulose synthase-like protein G2 n=1 Tax=Protea cynaroides TaxID=273540 RepID=A0A9Q0KEM6_9MAGN|nr:hypothetical protein NE237_015768 [Protea cynaroides]